MIKIRLVSCLLLVFALSVSCRKAAVSSPDPSGLKTYTLDMGKPVWADEFDYKGSPDPTKWGFDTGGHGWGNNELEMYTSALKNAEVGEGLLRIHALKERSGANEYTSARLVTRGKGDLLYGRVEVKARLPKGLGTWPAIWMLPTGNVYGNGSWPDNGEIDIMEHVGFDQGIVHANIHTKAFNHSIGTNKGNKMLVAEVSENFNVYACNWYPDSLSFEINGKTYFRFKRETSYGWEQWPFDKPFHLVLNIAVGGNWGGLKGVDFAVFPQKMEIDYVRFYGLKEQKK